MIFQRFFTLHLIMKKKNVSLLRIRLQVEKKVYTLNEKEIINIDFLLISYYRTINIFQYLPSTIQHRFLQNLYRIIFPRKVRHNLR